MKDIARLLITCPDKPGIVSAVTAFLHLHGANIIDLDQHTSAANGGAFFMRLEFQTPLLDLSREALEKAFGESVGRRFDMQWRIRHTDDVKKTAVLVSKHDHALMEILWRAARRETPCSEITMVISNHDALRGNVESFGVPFHHVSVEDGDMARTEARMLEILDGKADTLILARYMRILSSGFVDHFPNKIINIHHSFLPAFAGADPYRQAHEKGVKIIGATAHYVTAELDCGPIIEQDVQRVTHRFSVEDLKLCGMDLERNVLARAVKWHMEDRVIVYGNKTVVFR